MSPQAFFRRSLDTTSLTVVYHFFPVNPFHVISHEKCLQTADVTGFFLVLVHSFDVNGQSTFLSVRFSTLSTVIADVVRFVVQRQVPEGRMSGRAFITLKPLGLSKVNPGFMLFQSTFPFALKFTLIALDFSCSVYSSDVCSEATFAC